MNNDNVLKKFEKYYLFIKKNSKLLIFNNNSNKKLLFDSFKNKYINNYDGLNLILLKIYKVKYNPKQPIKMIFGPIKVEINFFELSKRGAIKTNKYETRNNHLFYTTEYLDNNKISKKDFKKIVTLAIDNKLEKRLLAPKTIDQLNK